MTEYDSSETRDYYGIKLSQYPIVLLINEGEKYVLHGTSFDNHSIEEFLGSDKSTLHEYFKSEDYNQYSIGILKRIVK